MLLTDTSANAQQKKRPAERIEPGLFHLRRLDASVELRGTFEQFRVRSKDGLGQTNARQTNRTSLGQGLLTLNFAGDVVHPYLIDYYGSLGLGFSESRFREETLFSTDSDRASGFLSEFDMRADLFRTKPISGTVYGQRGEDRIGRLFLPSLRERRTAYGTAWVFKHDVVPMQLSFDHFETIRTGNRDRFDDERIVEDQLRYTLDWNIGEHHKLKLDYEHNRTQQRFQGSDFDLDTRRDQVRIDHSLSFGSDHQHRLVTFARVQEESGDHARDIIEFGPQLTLQHTPDLSTYYAYQFTRERMGAIEVDLHRADFQIRHQFLHNLTTTFDVFGLEERTDDDVETSQGGASIAWNYVRNNPYGQLSAELRLAGDSERTRGVNGTRLIVNESGTFRDPLPVYLVKPDVAATSIVVTDSTGRMVYRAGVDYALTRTRNRTALYRIATGRISNGQSVLVDYRYRTPAKGRIDTTRIDFSIQQAFSWGLTPYYRLNFRHQEIDSSTGFAFIPDRTDHHRLGVGFQRPRWSIKGEYEIFDDAIDPYDAFHLSGNVQAIRDDRQSLDFRAGFSQYLFEEGIDDREVTEVNVSAHHDFQIDDYWSTSLRSTWRWEDDSVRGTTNGFDMAGSLAFRRGYVTVELTLEYDLLRIAGSREDGMSAWLTLRWDFKDGLRVN